MKLTLTALVALALTALTACGGGTRLGQPPGGGPVLAPGEVVCAVELYGDSILAGQGPGGQLAETPAQRLKQLRPRYQVTTFATAGQTATQASAVFATGQRAAGLIVIEHGTNDMVLGLPLAAPLREMVRTAKQEGRHVVVTGLSRNRWPTWPRYVDEARDVAVAEGAVYADWPSVKIETVDGTHPDQASTNYLVDRLAAAMDEAWPECR